MSSIFWITTEGKDLLKLAESIAKECNYDMAKMSLKLHERCKDSYKEYARQAAEIIYLRRKANNSGKWSEDAYYTTSSLEQSSETSIATHHAALFKGLKSVLEVCTGSGSDTAAIARVVERVTTVESNPLLAEMAQLNFKAQNLNNINVIQGDAIEVIKTLDLDKFDGFFCDPSRRFSDGRRISNPDEYQPPLSWVFDLKINGVAGVKISPGYNFKELPSGWARQWIGFKDECREQLLWKGTDILDGSVSLVDVNQEWTPPSDSENNQVIKDVLQGDFIVEPHAALIRSGKLHLFYIQKSINLLDKNIAYGVSSADLENSPFYTKFKVLEVMPFDFNKLRARVKELCWNTRTEIKKRGVDQDPDVLRKKIKFLKPSDSDKYGVIILIRAEAAHYAILAERCI